jgi:hypothetical protein
VASCAAYLRGAAGRVYGARGPLRLVQAMVLAVSLGSIVLGYRFVIFLVTLYTT